MRSLALAIFLGLTIPSTGWSQSEAGRLWGPRSSQLFGAKPPPGMMLVLGDTIPRPIRPTYWKEGAIVGGVVLGLLGAAFGGGMCAYADQRQNCTGATLGGVLVGSLTGVSLGALLGGQFHKPKASRSLSDSIGVDR
jgi:hypothetical protein